MNRLKVLLNLLLAAVAMFACAALGLIGLALISPLIAQGMAGQMMPPRYPGSRLIDSAQGGGSAAGAQQYLYATGDTVAQVEAFYERYMPAASSTYDISEFWRSAHQRCDVGLLAQLISRLEQGPFDRNPYLPCAGVDFGPDPKDPGRTLIDIWLHWPSS
jgi:hypothetical protein